MAMEAGREKQFKPVVSAAEARNKRADNAANKQKQKRAQQWAKLRQQHEQQTITEY